MQINEWRSILFQHKLIGYNENLGVGYGNISAKYPGSEGLFVISGTQTGHLPILTPEHYSLVTGYDLEKNFLSCTGPIKASSEALTHAAVYALPESFEAVIHVHHFGLWENLLHKIPTTQEEITYGTPEMAKEVRRLWEEKNLGAYQIFAMAGHVEGLISFGHSAQEAGEILMSYFHRYT
ncbi:MAG: class II aldolase/adducin family protein [Bacteroidia bacterium]|nr:class II aldolase/adducin family protein [Bacteroidia bacterium]